MCANLPYRSKMTSRQRGRSVQHKNQCMSLLPLKYNAQSYPRLGQTSLITSKLTHVARRCVKDMKAVSNILTQVYKVLGKVTTFWSVGDWPKQV